MEKTSGSWRGSMLKRPSASASEPESGKLATARPPTWIQKFLERGDCELRKMGGNMTKPIHRDILARHLDDLESLQSIVEPHITTNVGAQDVQHISPLTPCSAVFSCVVCTSQSQCERSNCATRSPRNGSSSKYACASVCVFLCTSALMCVCVSTRAFVRVLVCHRVTSSRHPSASLQTWSTEFRPLCAWASRFAGHVVARFGLGPDCGRGRQGLRACVVMLASR